MKNFDEKTIGGQIESLARHITSDDKHRSRFLRAASRSNEKLVGRRFATTLGISMILLVIVSLHTRRNISSTAMDRRSTQEVEDRALEHARVHGMSVDFALSEVFNALKKNWTK